MSWQYQVSSKVIIIWSTKSCILLLHQKIFLVMAILLLQPRRVYYLCLYYCCSPVGCTTYVYTTVTAKEGVLLMSMLLLQPRRVYYLYLYYCYSPGGYTTLPPWPVWPADYAGDSDCGVHPWTDWRWAAAAVRGGAPGSTVNYSSLRYSYYSQLVYYSSLR